MQKQKQKGASAKEKGSKARESKISFQKISAIPPGSFVKLQTKDDQVEGILLPSASDDIFLVKLKSGYNIGIPRNDVLSVKIEKIANKLEDFPELSLKQSAKKLPSISFIITGGTISSRLDYETGGVKWLMKPSQLFFLSPELLDVVNIKTIERPFMIASENMMPQNWQKIAGLASKLLNEKENEGIIVTHGTDTLHFTAAALSFMLRGLNKPCVLTYSQRSTDRGSTDTVLNLKCSTYAALSDIAEVMLVGHASTSDDYCIAIRGTKARKMHSSRRDTFRPINDLPLAKVYGDGKLEMLQQAYNKKDKNKQVNEDTAFEEKVVLLKYYPGASPELLEFLIDKKYKGIVIEATGLGHVATEESKLNWIPAIKRALQQKIAVCFAPQTLYGRLDPFVYAPGRKLDQLGVIFCEDMLPETAYVKLGWVLGHVQNEKEVKHLMQTNIAGEINRKISEKAFLY